MAKPRKYTIEEFKQAVAEARSLRDTLIRLGLNATGGNYNLARKRIKDLNLSTDHWKGQAWASGVKNPGKNARPLSDYLCKDGSYISSYNLKHRLYKEGILTKKCSWCEISDWRDKPLALHLDHINGDKRDNRLENLRILCPNCHSQTSTFAGKNHGRYEDERSKRLGSGLSSAQPVKSSPNLSTDTQVVSKPVDPIVKTQLEPNLCTDCSSTISKKAKRCRSCAAKLQPSKIAWPSKEDLEKLVWEKSRLQLAKELNVSDKAIAKRCKALGIQQPPRGYWAKTASRS